MQRLDDERRSDGRFRRLAHFLFGNPAEVTLELRLHNVICVVAALLGFVTSLLNASLGLHLANFVLPMGYAVVAGLAWWLSRFRGRYRETFWSVYVLSLATLSVTWFYNAGSAGGIVYGFVLGLCFFPMVTVGPARVVVVAGIVADIALLFVLEHLHPEWVVPYADRDARLLDFGMATVYCSLLMVLGVSLVMRHYRQERQRAEREKEEIRRRGERLDADLAMARRIQLQLVPARRPITRSGFYYRTLDEVGGDLFTFIRYQNPDALGVFVSDVSGHGVPAAFITSMLKSALDAVAPATRDPALVLRSLNARLLHQTAGQFVTALYGIYDQARGDFHFALAGHPAPWLVGAGVCGPVPTSGRAIPLAIAGNRELAVEGREPVVERVVLAPGDKLLLFTDGLTEAVPMKSPVDAAVPDFETARLADAAAAHRWLGAEAFTRALVRELVVFRGQESFDDDVCVVCIEHVPPGTDPAGPPAPADDEPLPAPAP